MPRWPATGFRVRVSQRLRWAQLAILLACALAGCTVGPDYKRPVVQTPPAWRYASDTAGPLNSQMGDDSAVETIVGGIQALDKP